MPNDIRFSPSTPTTCSRARDFSEITSSAGTSNPGDRRSFYLIADGRRGGWRRPSTAAGRNGASWCAAAEDDRLRMHHQPWRISTKLFAPSKANGGHLVTSKFTSRRGTVAKFADTEGNVAGISQRVHAALQERLPAGQRLARRDSEAGHPVGRADRGRDPRATRGDLPFHGGPRQAVLRHYHRRHRGAGGPGVGLGAPRWARTSRRGFLIAVPVPPRASTGRRGDHRPDLTAPAAATLTWTGLGIQGAMEDVCVSEGPSGVAALGPQRFRTGRYGSSRAPCVPAKLSLVEAGL